MNSFRLGNHPDWPSHLREMRFVGPPGDLNPNGPIAIVAGDAIVGSLARRDVSGWELEVHAGEEVVNTARLVLADGAGAAAGITDGVVPWASLVILETFAQIS